MFDTPRRIQRSLRRRWNQRHFGHAVRRVLDLPPLARGSDPLTVLSMVQPRDTLAWLLALRSFARFVNPGRVVVVCDPAMAEGDRALLRRAVPHVELRRAEEFRRPGLPVGGTWERLEAITDYAREGYVLQLDADTVTLDEPDEVRRGVAAGHGVVLGELKGQRLMTLDEARVNSAPWQRPGLHVQGVAEYVLPEAGLADRRYVRGCSGFTGFAQSAGLGDKLLDFSGRMQRLLGQRWTEWGTEQVASNWLVANQPGTELLPFPDYGTPDQIAHAPRFVHFIGSMRFENGLYARTARDVLNQLR